MAKELKFSPKLFEFLSELKENNNRDWFEANRQRYIEDVRDPFLAFIAAFKPRLQAISPYLVADPKPVGGSMFRIYRDVRFSKSKEPYKTMASAYFNNQGGKLNAPGIYLHLEPGNSFMGVGLWQPDTATRRKVTDLIASKPDAWKQAISGKDFRKDAKFEGESLAKLPKQYNPDHHFAEDLKRKDFIAVSYFSQSQACSRDFIDRVDKICRQSAPFLGFLTKGVGLKF